MGELDKLELTTNELLERGWTKTLIKRFLPRPDGCVPVDHWANYRGQNTYASVKIWNIEQSEKFALAFRRTWNGRNKGRMKDTSPEAVLKKMRREHHPKIPKKTREEIKVDTLLLEAAGFLKNIRARGYRTPQIG